MKRLNNSPRQFLCHRCLLALVICYSVLLSACDSPRPPEIRIASVNTESLHYPAHVIRVGQYFVATELLGNRLAIAETDQFRDPKYIDKALLGTHFRSPHFLAPMPGDGVLVSEGWGDGVVYLDKLGTSDYARFSGAAGDVMKAPHGVCRSNDGWIYVADSLNSRLVRFRDLSGTEWQVFRDVQKLVAYGRQLLCRDDGVWIVNSYERREGINTGQGGNILRISEFESGGAEVITAFPDTNATGIAVIDDRWILVGLWGARQRLILVDIEGEFENRFVAKPEGVAGPPYGITVDEDNRKIYVSYTGDIYKKTQQGALVIYTY